MNNICTGIRARAAALMLCLLHALPLQAQSQPAATYAVSSNIQLVSNYVRRGIGQSSSNPAVQGGMNYVQRNGFYAGLWGSPVSWIMDSGAVDTAQYGSPSTEVDLYLGYRNISDTGQQYDFGLIRYSYLGNYSAASGSAQADSAEAYIEISEQFLSLKYSWSILDQFMTLRETRGTNYLELNAQPAIGDSGYTLRVHIGRQIYCGAVAAALDAAGVSPSYADYSLGIAQNQAGYVLSLTFSNTDASPYYTHARTLGGNWAGPTTVLALSRSF